MVPADHDEGPRRAMSVTWALSAVTVAAFLARIWLSRQVVSPFLYHDEGGYVAVGRALLGQAPELHGPSYAPGYGLLLAPFQAFLEPGGVHLAGKVLNAAALAALVPVAFALARRIGRLDPWLALTAAAAGSAVAGFSVQASMLLPEALLTLVTSGTVLLVHRWASRPTTAAGLSAGACAGAAYGLHTRGVAVVGAVVVVAVFAVVLRHVPVPAGASVIAGATVVAGAMHVLATWSREVLYPFPAGGKDAGDLAIILEAPLDVARAGLGHVWYLVFATGGLAALGAVAAARVAWRGIRSADGLVGAVVVLGLAASVVLSAVVHDALVSGGVDRPDKVVYGRYLQQWIPVLVVLAPTLALRWSRRAALVAVAGTGAFSLGIAAMLHTSYEPSLWSAPVAWHNIGALWLVDDVFGALWVVRTAVVFGVSVVVGLGAVVLLGRRTAWSVAFGVVLVAGALSDHGLSEDWAAPAARDWGGSHDLGPTLEDLGRPVSVDASSAPVLFHALNLQFWHPTVDVDLTGSDVVTGAPLRIDRLADGPPVEGAELIAVEERLALGLWAVEAPFP